MNTFGRKFMVSIFGESHGELIGVVIDGEKPTFTPVKKSTSPMYVYKTPTTILRSERFASLSEKIWKSIKNRNIGRSAFATSSI